MYADIAKLWQGADASRPTELMLLGISISPLP